MGKAPSVLRLEGLVKVYKGRRFVDGVSLELKQGEVVGLLGPNGAGKTTTFYMVMGLVRPNAGRVYLDGLDITNLPVHKRARLGIGYLAQEPSIFKRLTVEGNILLVLEMLGIPREERYRRLAILLDELGLSELRRSYGYQLSGGERRRVEIARALAIEPKFLLLDEPFTGIDPITVSELKGLIRHLKERGIGILLTDHNVRDALTVTDRAYILHQGRILTSGTSEELVKDPVARKFYLGEEFRL